MCGCMLVWAFVCVSVVVSECVSEGEGSRAPLISPKTTNTESKKERVGERITCNKVPLQQW